MPQLEPAEGEPIKNMKIVTDRIHFETAGNCDIINITDQVEDILAGTGLKNGILTVFVPGATGAVTTIEYEPGLVSDFRGFLMEAIKEGLSYEHNRTHNDGNATSHLRASLLGPSLTVPLENGKLDLGVWQNIIFVDMDNRPRTRELIIKIIGE